LVLGYGNLADSAVETGVSMLANILEQAGTVSDTRAGVQ
jgi:hypothetical protein